MRQIYQYDPVVGYRFIPGIKARILHVGGGYLVRTNQAGFQSDHEFRPEKDPARRRILLFGDSFTAGEGVSNGFRYSDCLEEILPDLEVYNYGLPASGTDQHYLMHQAYARDVDHDLLVIGVFVENIVRVASRYRRWYDAYGKPVIYAKPYFTIDDGELTLHGSPPQKEPLSDEDLGASEQQFVARSSGRFPALKKLVNRVQESRLLGGVLGNPDFKDRLLKLVRYQPINDYDDPSNPDWLVMRAVLEEWIRNHDRPAVVVPIPLFHHVAGIADPSAYRARLREAAEAAGGHFYCPLDGMRRPSLTACRELFLPDGHLSKAGHRALAESLAPGLEPLLEKKQA